MLSMNGRLAGYFGHGLGRMAIDEWPDGRVFRVRDRLSKNGQWPGGLLINGKVAGQMAGWPG